MNVYLLYRLWLWVIINIRNSKIVSYECLIPKYSFRVNFKEWLKILSYYYTMSIWNYKLSLQNVELWILTCPHATKKVYRVIHDISLCAETFSLKCCACFVIDKLLHVYVLEKYNMLSDVTCQSFTHLILSNQSNNLLRNVMKICVLKAYPFIYGI